MKKKLFVFSNENIFSQDEKFFCDNIDIKSSPEGLNKKFEVHLFGRKSNKKRAHEIKLKKIKIFSNIFSYLSEVIKSTKIDSSKYLVISISPYTFTICLNKIGLTLDSALPFIGELHHIDIGVPISKLSKVEKKILKVTYRDFKNIDLPSLPKNLS